MTTAFHTPLALCGPLRQPKQMLAEQAYGGHTSIHDDAMAEKLGFRAGPIEGPTHFSQFVPLLAQVWGRDWFERGCLSAHYQNMVVEGESVRAFVELPAPGATRCRAWAEKADGTPVLEGSATLGSGPTLLEERLAQLRPPQRLLILADLQVGQRGLADERVRMQADQHMGALYPFSLQQKLAKITEPSPWYDDASASPWGRPIIPLEMVSVSAIEAGELASLTRAGSTGCDDLLEAIAELAPDADVYDVEDGTSHAVYTADGAQIWALS